MSINSPDSIIISSDCQFSEDQKAIIERNVLKLTCKYMEKELSPGITPREIIGLTRGERIGFDKGGLIEAIDIFYDTRTGIIKKPEIDDKELKNGDYSVLRTYLLVYENGKKKILVVYPRGWLIPHNIQAVISGTEDKLISEGRWILPERINPDMIREFGNNVRGINEPWGKSKIVDNPFGDLVIFRSIELFNRKYGPSLAESLFNA